MREISAKRIRRTLRKYELADWEVDLSATHRLRMVGVTDPYQLLDRMLENNAEQEESVRFPYWAEIWPSSIALGRWFLESSSEVTDHRLPELAPGHRVLELGCGLGLLGIGIAMAGWKVTATDFVEDALTFSAYNAASNGVAARHRVSYLDWRRPVGDPVGCIVGADLVYERANHQLLANLLRQLLLPGGRFILGDPRRPMASHFCRLLADQGYAHQLQSLEVRWKSTSHKVHIHLFDKPGS